MSRRKDVILDEWYKVSKPVIYKIADIMRIPQYKSMYDIFEKIQRIASTSQRPDLFLTDQILHIKAIPGYITDADDRTLGKSVNAGLSCMYKICVISCYMYTYCHEYLDLANMTWANYYAFYNFAFEAGLDLRPLLTIPDLISRYHIVERIRPPQNKTLEWYKIHNWKLYLYSTRVVPLDGNEVGNVIQIHKFYKDSIAGSDGTRLVYLSTNTTVSIVF